MAITFPQKALALDCFVIHNGLKLFLWIIHDHILICICVFTSCNIPRYVKVFLFKNLLPITLIFMKLEFPAQSSLGAD